VNIKGYALESLVDYINTALDEKRARELREKLPEKIASSSWYPMQLYFDILEELERNSREERGAVSREVGRFKAQHAAQGPHRLFFIFASPRFLIKRAGAFWGFYHDWGTIKIKKHYDKGVDLTIEHQEAVPEIYFYTVAGWMERSLEIAGTKCPKVEFTAERGVAEFRLRWD